MHPVKDIRRSGATLTVKGLNWVQNCDACRNRWASNYYITPVTGSSVQLERRCWNENNVPAEAGPPGPQLSSPGERESKAVIARRVGGQYVAVLFSLQLTSHTVKPFVTLSNKVWGLFFSRTVFAHVLVRRYVPA